MPRSPSRPPHPGRTPAERRALDAIGCGETLPVMHPKVRQNLLDAGLIEQCGERLIGTGPFAVRVPQYQMPVLTHFLWCSAVAVTDEQMDEFEAANLPTA